MPRRCASPQNTSQSSIDAIGCVDERCRVLAEREREAHIRETRDVGPLKGVPHSQHIVGVLRCGVELEVSDDEKAELVERPSGGFRIDQRESGITTVNNESLDLPSAGREDLVGEGVGRHLLEEVQVVE